MFSSFFSLFFTIVAGNVIFTSANSTTTNTTITILHEAVSVGAVCLDGTPPAYYHSPGHGDGSKNWLVVLNGGAWCASEAGCRFRTGDPNGLGSSNLLTRQFEFQGILSSRSKTNPDFYSWNRVLIAYCDGASFSANIQLVNSTTNLHFRGARIFDYVLAELKSKGMNEANNAILGGGSAGGLAAMLKCDGFRAQLPNVPRVKCIADSGYFFRGNTTLFPSTQESYFDLLVKYHQLGELLPKSCTSRMSSPELCIFPQNFVGYIKTPLFIINSQFDSYQMDAQTDVPNKNDWLGCLNGTEPCKPTQINWFKEFQKEFVQALPRKDGSMTRGLYITSCFCHGIFLDDFHWTREPKLKNTTISKAFGDWYFERSPFQELDNVNHPYSCSNPKAGGNQYLY